MPGGKTSFQQHWLDELDCSGQPIKKWCTKGSDGFSGYCCLCKKTVACDNSGIEQLKQHAKGTKHTRLVSETLSTKQLRLDAASFSSAQPSGTLKLKVHDENVLKAEAIWCMTVASKNFSFRSCDGIADTFRAMFPCQVTDSFTMSKSKVSYVLSDGLGPYFTSELVNDVNSSDSVFTLHYDETTTSQVKKQMDCHLRYWSAKRNEVCVRYYKSMLFGHAKGVDVAESILNSLTSDGLKVNKLVALSNDGPNVNKTIWTSIQVALQNLGNMGMVDTGTCNIHVVHNSFSKGKEIFGSAVEELATCLFSFFKYSAARREDFAKVQADLGLEEHMMQRHVSSRWLTLGPVTDRIIEQLEAIRRFVGDMVKENPNLMTSGSVALKKIHALVNSKEVIIELYFIQFVVKAFQPFLLLFQRRDPQVHILYKEMCSLIQTLMLRYVKADLVASRSGKKLMDVKHNDIMNQLPDDLVVIGDETRKQLTKLKTDTQHRILISIRNFYTTVVSYLLANFPLANRFLQDLGCLNPLCRDDPTGIVSIRRVAEKLKCVLPSVLTSLEDEWKVYQLDSEAVPKLIAEYAAAVKRPQCVKEPENEESDDDMDPESHGDCVERRVDHFWSCVFELQDVTGKPRYQTLQKVVKASLVIAHGNADVERGLSDNKRVLTKERTKMSLDNIIGIRSTQDAVRFYDPKSENAASLPITRQLLLAVRNSHAAYTARREKKKQELEQKKRDKESSDAAQKEKEKQQIAQKVALQKQDEELVKKQHEAQDVLKTGESLLADGNAKLTAALNAKDFHMASIAQAIIEAGQKKCKAAREQLEDIESKKKDINRKRKQQIPSASSSEPHSKKHK